MAGGKLARLLLVGGGASGRDGRTAASGAPAKAPAGDTNGAAARNGSSLAQPHAGKALKISAAGVSHNPPPAADSDADAGAGGLRPRKRRRGGAGRTVPLSKAAKAKRAKKEAGPSTKAPATTPDAVLAAGAEELDAERQQLLAGRSAYEALMSELSRGGAAGSSGRKAGGGGADSDLRALLQRLRNEQMGESSEEEEEEEEAVGEEGEGEEDGSDSEGGDGEEGAGMSIAELEAAVAAAEAEAAEAEAEAAAEAAALAGAKKQTPAAAAAAAAAAGKGGKGKGKLAVSGAEDGADGADEAEKDDEEEEDENDEEEEEGAALAGRRAGGGGASTSAANGGRPAAPVVDSWARHVGRELADWELVALESGKSDYRDAPPAEPHSRAWGGSARWQLRVFGSSSSSATTAATAAAAGSGAKKRKGGGSENGGAGVTAAAAAAAPAVGLTALPAAPPTLPEYGVKERLIGLWREVHKEEAAKREQQQQQQQPQEGREGKEGKQAAGGGGGGGGGPVLVGSDFVNEQQRSLFSLLNSYADVHLPARPYPTDASPSAPDPLMDAVLLHCLNHVTKAADRIKKNNAVLAAAAAREAAARDAARMAAMTAAAAGGGGAAGAGKRRRRNGRAVVPKPAADAAAAAAAAVAGAAGAEKAAGAEALANGHAEGNGGAAAASAADGAAEGRGEDVEETGTEAGNDEEEEQQEEAGQQEEKEEEQQEAGQQEEEKQPDAAAAAEGPARDMEAEALEGGTPRDQGFTRPKVLLLLPLRNSAFRAVRRLVRLALRETRSDSVQGKEKFLEQFTDPEEMAEEENMDEAARARLAAKPSEHRALFAGNIDDHFRLGIKVTKGAVKLFADLYQSDIIVASPVALATKLAEDKRADPHSQPDFLSSVELLVIDRADVMAMQNWAHVETVVAALNRLPRQQHGTDIMRVRDWYLAGQAARYRQTVLLSSHASAQANALVRATANHAGGVRLQVEQPGVLGAVVPQVRQLFERFHADSPAAVGDARFEFFMRTIWPRVKDSVSRGLLLFVPSYFDFVRLRNALKDDDSVDFATVSEYSSNAEVTRSRARFFHGQRRMLIYTERAHFYHRYRIRGIKDVLFYGLPDHGHFYPELLNLLEEGGAGAGAGAGLSGVAGFGHATVTALFCGWDVLQLERVVGSARARRMLRGESSTYMFC